jgi:hypothetical protein
MRRRQGGSRQHLEKGETNQASRGAAGFVDDDGTVRDEALLSGGTTARNAAVPTNTRTAAGAHTRGMPVHESLVDVTRSNDRQRRVKFSLGGCGAPDRLAA